MLGVANIRDCVAILKSEWASPDIGEQHLDGNADFAWSEGEDEGWQEGECFDDDGMSELIVQP